MLMILPEEEMLGHPIQPPSNKSISSKNWRLQWHKNSLNLLRVKSLEYMGEMFLKSVTTTINFYCIPQNANGYHLTQTAIFSIQYVVMKFKHLFLIIRLRWWETGRTT
jgi:hypothetical protein